jgi:hypothetical protein
MLEGHDTIQPQDIQDHNDGVQYVEMCVATKILSAKGNWTFFFSSYSGITVLGGPQPLPKLSSIPIQEASQQNIFL